MFRTSCTRRIRACGSYCRSRRPIIARHNVLAAKSDITGQKSPPVQPIQGISRRFAHAFIGVAMPCSFVMPVTSKANILNISEVKDRVQADFVEKQYYVTGDLSPDLYKPDCTFIDPTVEVKGVTKYVDALKILFDPSRSKADLISIDIDSPTTIVLRWRLEGYLRLGGLKFKPYTGTTTYFLDADNKISKHFETWDISVVDAFISTLIPSFGSPPAPPITSSV